MMEDGVDGEGGADSHSVVAAEEREVDEVNFTGEENSSHEKQRLEVAAQRSRHCQNWMEVLTASLAGTKENIVGKTAYPVLIRSSAAAMISGVAGHIRDFFFFFPTTKDENNGFVLAADGKSN